MTQRTEEPAGGSSRKDVRFRPGSLHLSMTRRLWVLGASFVASRQFTRLESHQLADDSSQGTPAICSAAICPYQFMMNSCCQQLQNTVSG
jgi:hypothetical protein